MKNFYAILILFICFNTFAQQKIATGLIKDATTNEPIVYASVGIKDSHIGTISNEEGNFQITVPNAAKEIMVSCVGYKTAAITVSEFTSETKTIKLEPDEQLLDEVVVSKTPIEKILQELITTSRARFNKPIVLHTYYREFVKINGKYSKFSDGLLDYHISGTTKKNKSDLIVKQSRAAQLFTEKELEDDELIDFDTFLNVQKGVTDNYDFTFLKKLLLDSDNYENYDLELKSKKDRNGKELFAIHFEPKPNSGGLYKGFVVYDPETKLIYDIDIDFPDVNRKFKERNFLIARVTFMENTLRSGYKLTGNNYILAYSNSYRKLRITIKKRKYDKTIESKSDLVVTDLEKDDLSYQKALVYKERDLYKSGNKFSDKFWLKNNSLVLTRDEEKIISDLEKTQKATVQ